MTIIENELRTQVLIQNITLYQCTLMLESEVIRLLGVSKEGSRMSTYLISLKVNIFN